MTLSLRIKILLSVGIIIFVVLATSTFIHIREFKQSYFEAIEWRSEVMAEDLLND